MAEKPATLPVWATDGGTTVEPSAGQKAAGFAVSTRPPARWVNWVLNLIYGWIQYLNAPVGTGAGAGFSATGGSTSGPGLQGAGGGPNGSGVKGIAVGAGDGGNFAADTTGRGAYGQGGSAGGHGGYFKGTANAGNSHGVLGEASYAPNAGVRGVGGPGGATGVHGYSPVGYGMIAEGDASSPALGAFRMVPQDTEPSGPNQVGDMYMTTAGVVKVCTVAGSPGTWVSVGAQT